MDEAQLLALIDNSNRIADGLEITAEKASRRDLYYAAAGAYRQASATAAVALELQRYRISGNTGPR